MIGSISAAMFIIKALESEDGSSTPLALILVAALFIFGNIDMPEPLARASATVEQISKKLQAH